MLMPTVESESNIGIKALDKEICKNNKRFFLHKSMRGGKNKNKTSIP